MKKVKKPKYDLDDWTHLTKKPGSTKMFNTELTTDCDTDQYGLIVWLGTKDKAEAHKRADKFIKACNGEQP